MHNITLQDQTYEKIREMIIKTELVPGQKISESTLMELLDVGRTPIRESLKQLKKQNLVFTFPQSGTFVSKIDMDQAVQSIFVRECIEKEIMVELCDHLGRPFENKLHELIDDQKSEVGKGNSEAFYDLGNAFHRTCYERVGKSRIWEWVNELSVHLDRFRWLHLKEGIVDHNQIIAEHKELLDAIISRRTEEVKYLVVNHLHSTGHSKAIITDKYPEFFKNSR